MTTTLRKRLETAPSSPLSLKGLVPLVANQDPNVPAINDSYLKGTYDESLRPADAQAASRITPLPKRP
jgi:hypothetical protein